MNLSQHTTARPCRRAFTLLEVMIAAGIFFMASFGVLSLVSQSLRGAKALQRPPVDAGLAASILVSTNRFEVDASSHDFEDEALRDYSWRQDVYEIGTNGLLGGDIVFEKRGLKNPFDKLSIIVFDPNAKKTPFKP